MNNLVTNFDQIVEFAERMGVPVDKKRGIIREYLQSKFISILYSLPDSQKLSFVGGTGLRLIRGLNRFSEDLDFDNLGLSNDKVRYLVSEVVKRFQTEGISTELKLQTREEKTYFELKFPNLLKELKITTNPKEKLMVKFDYASSWKAQTTETILFSKYGFIESVVVNELNQNMVQKLVAYLHRKTVQPRDIYDIVWMYSQGARPDTVFAENNGFGDIVQQALAKFNSEGVTPGFKNRLAPFLFNPADVSKLDLFRSVLKDLLGKAD